MRGPGKNPSSIKSGAALPSTRPEVIQLFRGHRTPSEMKIHKVNLRVKQQIHFIWQSCPRSASLVRNYVSFCALDKTALLEVGVQTDSRKQEHS